MIQFLTRIDLFMVWFKKPINYRPKILPRSQDARPVIIETTGLYGITKRL